MKRFLSLWAPVLCWMGLIFYASSIPSLNSGLEWDYLYRKAAHMAEYAILAILLRRAIGNGTLSPNPSPVNGRGEDALPPRACERRVGVESVVLALTVLYAVSDEFHQGFVPGRGPSVVDVLIDAAGAFAGLFLYRRKTDRISHGSKT